MPDQRLVAAGGEEGHQPHSKDVGTPTKPDTPALFIKSRHDDGLTPSKPLPEFNPDDHVGRTFLLPPANNEERIRTNEKADGKSVQNPSYILRIGNGKWRKSSPITNLWTICFVWVL